MFIKFAEKNAMSSASQMNRLDSLYILYIFDNLFF